MALVAPPPGYASALRDYPIPLPRIQVYNPQGFSLTFTVLPCTSYCSNTKLFQILTDAKWLRTVIAETKNQKD